MNSPTSSLEEHVAWRPACKAVCSKCEFHACLPCSHCLLLTLRPEVLLHGGFHGLCLKVHWNFVL